ncbi:preprotein translocase subunit YajC [Sporichthya sp.]|uniref:preprotein translocase subunit YajC n=1 Tax=Sporichthya sp. TaxID=65475 RepID=UPI001806BA1D|nr:preprotein translocase subunit YajC [Sporichthya sp.]MBA3742940.1 preprotein translocase subunit YajC [Sporichthya sp.]
MEAILPIVLLVAAFYLLVLRPTQMRSRRAKDLNENLRPGVEIITTAGMLGTVLSVEDDEVRLEIAPGVVIRLLTGAVGKILHPENTASTGDGAAAGETADEGGKGSGPASPTSH